MLIRKSFKYRIITDKEQDNTFFLYAHGARFIYNWGLQHIKEIWEANQILFKDTTTVLTKEDIKARRQQLPSYFVLSKKMTEYKQTPDGYWLYQIPNQILQQSLKDLDAAMQHFFRRIRQKDPGKKGFPVFKNRNSENSFRFVLGIQYFGGNTVTLTRIGVIKFILSRPLEGKIKQAIIKRDGKHWYISFSCAFEKDVIPVTDIKTENIVLCEEKSDMQFYRSQMNRIATLNQALARKAKDSKNRDKCRAKLQSVYIAIKNRRKDYLHKWSTKLVMESDKIIIDNLPIKEYMAKDPELALAFADMGWHAFIEMLRYKCLWYGKQFQ